jgi:hypothetical protein
VAGASWFTDASLSSFFTADSDASAAHAHAPVAATEVAPEGSGSSGSSVISAIISRSCGERTEDVPWAAFGMSGSDGPKWDGDEADVDICAFSERLIFFFFFNALNQRDLKMERGKKIPTC